MDEHQKMTTGLLLVLVLVFAVIIEILLFIALQNFIRIEKNIQFHQHEFMRLR